MLEIKTAQTESEIQLIADAAERIWHEHFTPIIGADQVRYMLDKFQSFAAIRRAVFEDGYRYYYGAENGECHCYCGIHPEDNGRVFLSKLYVEKPYRGQGLSRRLLERVKADFPNHSEIYLTVNKHNDNTIAIYKHMGFVLADSAVTDIGDGFVMDDYIFTLAY